MADLAGWLFKGWGKRWRHAFLAFHSYHCWTWWWYTTRFVGTLLIYTSFTNKAFVKNRSCVTQIYITKIAAKCILVVGVKWRHHANVVLPQYALTDFNAQLRLQQSDANQMLSALRYFERPIKASSASEKGVAPKASFSWGVVEMSAVGNCLLSICQSLKETLLEEPRLLKIQSPAYIVGKTRLLGTKLTYGVCVLFLVCNLSIWTLPWQRTGIVKLPSEQN